MSAKTKPRIVRWSEWVSARVQAFASRKSVVACLACCVILSSTFGMFGCGANCASFSRHPGYEIQGLLTDASGNPIVGTAVDLVLSTENGVMGPFKIETDGEGFLDIFLPTGPISDGAGCPPPNPSSGASARPTGVVIVVHRSTGSVTLTFEVVPQLDHLATWEMDLGTFQVESD